MPDFWTHIIAGENIVEASQVRYYSDLIKHYKTAFNFGCQGSDLLFYNLSTPWQGPVYAKKMHYNKLKTAFQDIVDRGSKNTKEGAYTAFLTGYITHFLVDKGLHAFILARSPNFTVHKEIENEIDTFLLSHFKGKNSRELNPASAIDFKGDIPESIEEFFADHMSDIYNFQEGSDLLNKSFRDFKYLQKLLYSPGGVKRTLLRASGAFIPYNLDSLLYDCGSKHLWPEERTRFLDYYNDAVTSAGEIMNQIIFCWKKNCQWNLDDSTFSLDLNPPGEEELAETLPV